MNIILMHQAVTVIVTLQYGTIHVLSVRSAYVQLKRKKTKTAEPILSCCFF